MRGTVRAMNHREPPPQLVVADAAAWRAWLDDHEYSSDGVRLVLAKKGTTVPTSLSYAEALEEARCNGWIGWATQFNRRPPFPAALHSRRARSIWSRRNVGIVDALIASGRMHVRGRAEAGRAKADGLWERAYPRPASASRADRIAK